MKHVTLFIFGIFLSFYAIAQDEIHNIVGNDDYLQEKNINYFSDASSPGRLYTFRPRNTDIEGSPYLVEGQVSGKLFTSDSVLINNMPFKYNSHDDCVEIITKGEATNLFAHKIKGFSFHDRELAKTRVFVNGFKNYANNFSPLTYYEVLYSGNVKLLVKHNKPMVKIPSKISTPGINTNTATKRYSYAKHIYIQDGNSFIPIKFNRGSIMESIGNAEIRKFLKENKNKCRKAEDVIEVLKFYEKLKEIEAK
jgi:hypothetical protein